MPRTHIVQSWVGSAEYDEGDTYNGQQVGNRNQKSIGVHVTRSGDQWYANTAAYAEPEKKAPAKKPSAFSQIMLADRNYERLSGLSEALDLQLDNGELSLEDWAAARKNIDKRLSAAWLKVCKERNWNESGESLDNSLEEGLTFNLEDIQSQQIVEKNKRKTYVQTGWVVVDGLSEENVFRGLFCRVKQVILFIERIKQQF